MPHDHPPFRRAPSTCPSQGPEPHRTLTDHAIQMVSRGPSSVAGRRVSSRRRWRNGEILRAATSAATSHVVLGRWLSSRGLAPSSPLPAGGIRRRATRRPSVHTSCSPRGNPTERPRRCQASLGSCHNHRFHLKIEIRWALPWTRLVNDQGPPVGRRSAPRPPPTSPASAGPGGGGRLGAPRARASSQLRAPVPARPASA